MDADLRGTQDGVRDDPRFAPDFSQLYDLTAVTEIGLTPTGMRALANRSPFDRDARRAIVVSSDVAFGMARMYQMIADSDPTQFRIFRDVNEAFAWLLATE